MNTELMLKLQSWVDGELPDADARHVAEIVRTDKEAASLVGELKMTRSFLAGNEPEAKLTDSREFYWSKIERGIERAGAEPQEQDSISWLAVLRRYLVPVSGVALVLFLTVVSLGVFNRPPEGAVSNGDQLVEETKLSQHVETFSYKTKAENMFVVYIVSKDGANDDDEPDADLDFDLEMDDAVIQ